MDDFKKLVCISEEDIARQASGTVKRPVRKIKFWVGFSIGFVLLCTAGTFLGNKINSFFISHSINKSILTKEWITKNYGIDGLSVSTPFELKEGELPLPAEVLALIDHSSMYTGEIKGLTIMVNNIGYKPEIGEGNLQGAANGAAAQMESQKGVSEFDYSEKPDTLNDIPGIIQEGSFLQDKKKVSFINAIYLKERTLRELMVIYYSDDEVAREAANRVINSAKIEKSL